MTQKKLRLVRARMFGMCSVRRGAWNLDDECSVAHVLRPEGPAAHGCIARRGGAVSRTLDHARPVVR